MHSSRGIYAPILSREQRKAVAEIRLAELLHQYQRNRGIPCPERCPLCKRVTTVRGMSPIVSATVGGVTLIAIIWILSWILEQF